MERNRLLEELTILDFAAIDLALYLNTHPDDHQAITYYNDVTRKANDARAAYEKAFGPLTSFRSSSSAHSWDWNNEPWPWDYHYNFYLDERRETHVGL